jgi:hypothetical protein
MTKPRLNLIRTRTTFYRGRDGKARAVLMLRDYNSLLKFCYAGDAVWIPARV